MKEFGHKECKPSDSINMKSKSRRNLSMINQIEIRIVVTIRERGQGRGKIGEGDKRYKLLCIK